MTNAHRLTLSLSVAIGVATGCSPQPEPEPNAQPAPSAEVATAEPLPAPVAAEEAPVDGPAPAAPSTLDRAFHPDMLDVDIAYFEQTSGVPRRSEDGEREYRIDGCDMRINLLDGKVRNMRLELGESCHADLNRFLPDYGIPNTAQLTFGSFMKAAGSTVDWYADCLKLCGNAYDPSVYMDWTAPRSNLVYTVVLEGMARGATPWEEAMEREKG